MSKTKPLPSKEYLHECFEYNSETGILIWKHRPREHYSTETNYIGSNKRFVGKQAGSIKSKEGYLCIRIADINYAVHRIIWKYMTGFDPFNNIDHINNIRHDNRWCNLREATDNENARNKLRNKNNTSGVKNVTWDKESGKWLAQIREGKRNIKVGRFTDIKDAEEAIRLKRIEMYKDYHNHGESKSPYA
jgi:hypothetical protein